MRLRRLRHGHRQHAILERRRDLGPRPGTRSRARRAGHQSTRNSCRDSSARAVTRWAEFAVALQHLDETFAPQTVRRAAIAVLASASRSILPVTRSSITTKCSPGEPYRNLDQSPASGLAPEAKPAPEPARDRQCCRIRLAPAMLGDVLDLLKLDPQPRGMQDGRVEHSPIRGRRDVSKGVGRSHPVRLIGRSHHAIGNWVRFAKSRLSLVACGSILCPIRLLKNASPRRRLASRRAYLDLVLSPSSTRRRIASGRDGLSSCAAAQASIRERGPVNSLTPIKVPLPVVRGRPRFFVLSLIDFGAIWVNTKGIGPPRC